MEVFKFLFVLPYKMIRASDSGLKAIAILIILFEIAFGYVIFFVYDTRGDWMDPMERTGTAVGTFLKKVALFPVSNPFYEIKIEFKGNYFPI